MARWCLLPLLYYLYCLPAAAAEPTGAQLLVACRTAVDNGFTGMEASMCDWYVTPCECGPEPPAGTARVCLPADVTTLELARQVIDGLQQRPELADLSAADAARTVLAAIYPCPD